MEAKENMVHDLFIGNKRARTFKYLLRVGTIMGAIQTEGEKSPVQLLLLHQHRSYGLAIDAAGGGLAAPAATLDEDDSDLHCSQNQMETSIE